jgi:putative ABC transport system permease protein
VVALASAVTFSASVGALVDSPERYGWTSSVAVQAGGGYDELDLDAMADASRVRDVDGLAVAGFGPLLVGADRVNAIGLATEEGPAPVTLLRGDVPTKVDEVALGAATARDLHAGVGDRIAAAGGPLRVTGIVALPAIGPLASAHPSLGQGALLTFEGLAAQDETTYPSTAFVHFVDGSRPELDDPRLAQVTTMLSHLPSEVAEAFGVLRPAEVVGLQPASRTANLLAGLLGGAAVLALGLTLSSSVRRRRETFAVLSSLGFDRRDLRRTVRWQTNVLTLAAIGVGLPLGVVAGRTAWTAFADQLGAAGGPRVPLAVLALAAAGLLLVANVVGEVPARRAGRPTAPSSVAR